MNTGATWAADAIQAGTFSHDEQLAAWLNRAGYRTGLFGKYGIGGPQPRLPPSGWDTWRQLTPGDEQAHVRFSVNTGSGITTPAGFHIDYLTAEIRDFLAGTRPWFAYVCPSAPHWPFGPPPDNLHAWSHVRWPIVDQTDVSDKPSWIRSRPPLTEADRDTIRTIVRGQLRELLALDRMVATVIETLRTADQLDDTLVVYTSDNGLHYGEHRITGPATKNDFYEVSLRVPLVIRGPGHRVGTTATPVNQQDVTRTIVEAAGATATVPLDGLDLRTIVTEPHRYSERSLLHQRVPGGGDAMPAGAAITTRTRKLARYAGTTTADEFEMYDLDVDPDESTNVARVPGRRGERDALEADLDALLA